MKSKMVSILISLIMVTNIFGAIAQNIGEPNPSVGGTLGLPPPNISEPIPQNVGQPCSNSCGIADPTISNIPPPIPKNVGQPSPCSSGSSGLADSPWPMLRQNLNHTGLSPYDTSANPGKLKWSYTTDWTVRSSPTIGSDGTIYVGSYDGKLYAINPDGTEKWTFTAESGIGGSPAIGFDGTIYIGSWDQKFYAINPDGSEKWSFMTGNAIDSSAAIGPDGTIYVGSHNNNLYAINPDGSEKWHFSTGSSVRSSPAVSSDGTIYVGSLDYKLYAIRPDGTEKWSFTTGLYIEVSSPAIGFDGTIYVGSRDNKLYAINPDGSKKWSFATGDEVASSPAIGSDGTIYIGSYDDKLYAINTNGSEKWNFTTYGDVFSSPAIGSDGSIYVGSRDNNLYAINPDGTEKWNFIANKDMDSSPAIGSDGTIYVGSHDYKLYAIGSFPPNITVEKTANVTHTKPGDTINYTIYYNNTITSDSTDELVHQQLTFENSDQSFPSYSPDGGKIVFSSFEDGGNYMDIWVMDADGSNHQQLTFEHASQEDPSFSPDGSKIVYYSYEDLDGDEDIWTMNSDGSNHQQLTDVSCQRYPSFSPDGSKIVYMSQEDGGFDYDIWIMNSDGSNHQQLTFEDVEQFYPSFSPDGSKIVYSSKEDGGAGLDIWIINTDGSNHQQLTFENDNHYHPSFSPDGSKIVYSSLEDGGMYEDIWIMNADGSDHQQLTNENVCQLWPTFSPDGEKITYQSKEDGGSYYDIWILTRSSNTIAKTVWINDTLPSDVTFVTSSAEVNRTGNYNWTFYDVEPGEHNFTITVQVNAGVPNGTILTNYVHLDLTDHRGNPMPGSFDSVDVIVIAEEYTPPVADAGPDQTVNEGDVVQFDGSNSTGSKGHMVRDPSVVALWHMNEGSGNVIHDETDNHHDGTIYGATWTSNGRFGNALSFDGIDDYIEIKPSDQIFGDNPDEWSYLLWYNLTQGFGNMSFISDYNHNEPNGLGYPFGDENLSINLDMDYSEFWDKYFIMSYYNCRIGSHGHGRGGGIKISYNDYNWHLAVVTVSKIDKCLRLYLDYDWGYTWFPLDDIGPYGDYFDGGMLRIGACFCRDENNNIGSEDIRKYFKGNIDEVVLFNRALTSQEILDYFESGKEYSPVRYDIPAEIISYEWDFEDDGIYDYVETLDNAPDGAFDGKTNHTYGDDGVYKATLRITDDKNLTDTSTCNITVLNVNPTITIESITMDVEIGLRVAGRKYNDVGMTLYEDGNLIGNVSIERMPGSPNEQMAWIPVSINFSRSYSATVTYTPEDPPNIGGNPVWIYIKSKNGSINKIHHTFNVQQSKKRDSDHWNHIEPWEVDLNCHFIGLPFEITSHVTDPGSDDETLTYTHGSQTLTVTLLNGPPNPDPYPSPEVNPVDLKDETELIYEGAGSLKLLVVDDDKGESEMRIDII